MSNFFQTSVRKIRMNLISYGTDARSDRKKAIYHAVTKWRPERAQRASLD